MFTGNLIRESTIGVGTPFAKLPNGETYFKNATGRCSNGLLMINYLAMATSLPFLDPYMNTSGDFGHGVNFAVAGSTTLPVDFLAKKNISTMVTHSSLEVQLGWMSTHFNFTCHNERDCLEMLKSSLFMVGEIGGNDYNYAFLGGKTMEEIKDIVPDVIQAITDAVRTVIQYGAVRVVVLGNFPIGCFPLYLTVFEANDTTAYDEHHCLKELNGLSIYHNNHLKKAIKELKQEFPNAVIVYGDYYNAFEWLFVEAPYIGFDDTSLQKACCGIGGKYNFNLFKNCGVHEVSVCLNPNEFISWDGVHLTQHAYLIMTRRLVEDMLPQLLCNFI
ncbi:acetylajmalan esterase-like [Diospyros lotus]|uniref:acetylajmalan esterase-like n=1 Tax=Diospyros lotus TaxID=55363 RepID=UPI00225379D5|nr:acetylajmalan esterase-like [Diospyros lotus]